MPNFNIARFLGKVLKHRNAAVGVGDSDEADTNVEAEKKTADETPVGRDKGQSGADDAQILLNNDVIEELDMAKLDDVTRDVVNSVDGALGCAVVDLSSGLILSAYHNVPYFTQTYLEAVAAAAVEMLRGKNVQAVEQLLTAQRGETVEKSIQEIQMTTEATYHFMAGVPSKKRIHCWC